MTSAPNLVRRYDPHKENRASSVFETFRRLALMEFKSNNLLQG
jgi:hypothetical protein